MLFAVIKMLYWTLNCIDCGSVKCIHYPLIHSVKQRWISAGQINTVALYMEQQHKNLGLLSVSVLRNTSQQIMVDVFFQTQWFKRVLSRPVPPSTSSLLYSAVVIQRLIFNADSACLNNDCPSLFLFYCHSLFFGQPVLSVCFSFISV